MTDLDRLNAALDAEPWFLLRQIADAHEERGDTALAAGYRWLAERRRLPDVAGDCCGWKLLDGRTLRKVRRWRWAVEWIGRSLLPLSSREVKAHWPGGGGLLGIPTPSAAYRAAAEAVGWALAKEAAP